MMRLTFLRDFGNANLGLALVWVMTIACGLIALLNYETRPGENPTQVAQWPMDSVLRHSKEKPTVVMFTHPHCPCTRSSMTEFEQVAANCRDSAEFTVIAFEPLDANDQWSDSAIVKKAEMIPGIEIFWDTDGCEARRFNVRTSGHVVAYDADGRLLFSGGITGSRGHEGANYGRVHLTKCLQINPRERYRNEEPIKVAVYGCGLVNGSENTRNAE